MEQLPAGNLDKRTGKDVPSEYSNWTQHPNNPMREVAE
jgi:dihydropyrimidine dehydrogenase (NAD+) subunit PreA